MSNTTAYASGTSAYVTDTKTGGGGRRGYAGAAGGGSTLSNSVSGKTTGGTLELTQTGRGGYGVAAAGGARKSYLTFNDFSANLTRAASFTGTSNAYGGNGGTPGGTTSVAAMTAAVRHFVANWRSPAPPRIPTVKSATW